MIFLALSLISYNPSDPMVELIYPLNQFYQPDILSYPKADSTANWCGPWGALAASVMLDALGIGAHYSVASLCVVTVLLLMRREIDSPVVRTIGWILTLVAITTLAEMVLPWVNLGPVVGPGGYLGLLGSGLLRMHFAEIGGLLIALSVFVAGVLLCTDYVLVHLGLFVGSLTMASVWGMRGLMGHQAEAAAETEEDEEYEYEDEDYEDEDEEEEEEEDSSGPVAIRVGGKRISADAEDDGEQEEDGEYEDDEEEDEEECGEEEYDDARKTVPLMKRPTVLKSSNRPPLTEWPRPRVP